MREVFNPSMVEAAPSLLSVLLFVVTASWKQESNVMLETITRMLQTSVAPTAKNPLVVMELLILENLATTELLITP